MVPPMFIEETEASPAESALCLSTQKDHNLQTQTQIHTHESCPLVPTAELPSSTSLGRPFSPAPESSKRPANSNYIRSKIKVSFCRLYCVMQYIHRRSHASLAEKKYLPEIVEQLTSVSLSFFLSFFLSTYHR